MESDTTSHLRPSILTSFLSRGSRPRSTAASPTGADSPGINNLNNNGPVPNHHHHGGNNTPSSSARRRGAPGGNTQSSSAATASPAAGPGLGQVQPATNLPIIMPAPTATSLSQMLRRRRSNNGNLNQAAAANNANAAAAATAVPPPPVAAAPSPAPHSSNAQAGSSSGAPAVSTGPAHRIRLVPHLENSRALHFDPITRECREGAPAIRIGRFTDRSGTLAASTNSLTGKIAFKSKVVSRGHAELWCEANGKFFVKDTSSSSGTFLNHIRLSSAGVESRPHLLKDGDILQLGVDYQGGTEEIYRCVKIRVEIGREWQAGPNPFNTSAMAQLKALSNLPTSIPAPAATNGATRPKTKKTTVSDCCICLFPVTVCQALFIAPCSHSFHYKCIRGTLLDHHPGFSCPLCRSFHNLEADVEVDLQEEDDEWEELPGNNPEGATANGLVLPTDEENQDASEMVQDDLAAMDISDGNGAVRRSIDDDDDLPLGFQTAAEHNDRRLLPQSLNHSHQNHLNQTLSPSQTLPNLPPPPPMPPTTTPRRAPRRGTMVQGQSSGAASPDDIDRGFETDTGVVGFGGETDMDVDEPRHHQGSHSRTGSGRGRAGMYNQNVVAAGNQTPHAAYSGSAGMSSAPNLLRPGSAMGHTLTTQGQPPSHIPGNATPPGLPYHSPVAIRSTTSSNPYHGGMGMSSSNPSASRMMMVSGSLPGTSSHLLGDSGTNGANGGGIGDRTMLGADKATEDLLLSGGEEQGVEAGASGGVPGAFGFGSKRKR